MPTIALVCAVVYASGAQLCHGPLVIEQARARGEIFGPVDPANPGRSPRVVPQGTPEFARLLSQRTEGASTWIVPAPGEGPKPR